ncbi:RNA-binding protein, predicted [Methanothermus fervidus DSM 2088]|uniref:RNA-binding protein, predicted n=1 Tax=Methanothermus fervidus (strain ATCC 43054 / DSM 2088 / JCM 10308 / V24 S) TaxID=523846 RepID=E3GZ02_METFV|nr:CooT family nickel-binding protein [Methanothermus fervidus]ADP77534.1 RNA-binding protein, predicted [Methanothermus fervidus DSM 2088]
MCESKVYLKNGELLMDDVILIKVDGDEIYMKDILNRENKIKGKIVEIDLDKHEIIIEKE